MEFTTAEELLALCGSENITIADVMRRRESTEGELDPQTVEEKMKKALDIMRDSAHKPMSEILPSRGGMIGGEAAKLSAHAAAGRSICGSVLTKALIYSQAVPEVNASMGVIVAAPTAGLCVMLPSQARRQAARRRSARPRLWLPPLPLQCSAALRSRALTLRR